MKKNLILLLFLIPFFCYSSQTSIVIGNGIVESFYGPVYIFNSTSTNTHSWNQSIYTRSEILAAGGYSANFNGISWYKTDTGAYLSPDATFEIYIKPTTLTDFAAAANFDIEVNGATLVYSSTTQTIPRSINWVDFIFDTPYNWNGVDNIMILTKWRRIGNGTDAIHWQSTNTGSTTVSHSFNTNPAMGTLFSTAVRPNIMIELSPQSSNDAGIVSIDSVRGACPGNVDVYATVKNFGINPITTLQIDWKIDGVLQIPFNYSGNLAPVDTSQIFLGTSLFVAGIGQTFDVWTSNPNGVTDTTTVNDTLAIAGLMPGLNGTYTIGSVSADFSSFNSAVAFLENNGACGPVEFTVNPGNYMERVIIHEIPNASAINNITFRSVANDSTSVILEWPSSTIPDSNYTLLLYGVKHITFQGITFSRTGTNANCTVVEMDNGSGEVYFYNNRFIGPDNMSAANTSGSQSGIFNQGGSRWSVVTIRKNYFLGNSNGVWVYGYPLTHSDNLIIEDNVFETFYVGAFVLYQNGPVIQNNICTRNNTNSTIDYFGISLRYISGVPQVVKNKITAYTGSYGIRLRESVNATASRAVVANNFVQAGSDGTGRGIAIEAGSTGIDIFHNSVNYSGTDIALGRALYIEGTASGDLRILNNIFSNSGGGYASYVSANATGSISISNNNCLFTTGTTLGFFGTAQSTLANLQAASLMDSNSVNANPNFLTFNDLHTVAGPLADAGSGLALIESDIDGESRDLGHPDIGADEFSSVGITDINLDESIKIYPNPANENLFVDLIFENNHGLFTVIDITGREVLHQKLNWNKNVVDVSGLLEGFYLLKMELDGRVLVKKFVVRR